MTLEQKANAAIRSLCDSGNAAIPLPHEVDLALREQGPVEALAELAKNFKDRAELAESSDNLLLVRDALAVLIGEEEAKTSVNPVSQLVDVALREAMEARKALAAVFGDEDGKIEQRANPSERLAAVVLDHLLRDAKLWQHHKAQSNEAKS